MTEKARKIFDMLGVEPGVEFRIVTDGMLCRFNEDLELQYQISERFWEAVENVDTYRGILVGKTKIIKNPKLTEEDKIVIAYARLCGCKWIARDKDGLLYAFEEKPDKWDDEWMGDEGYVQKKMPDNISVFSFVSWEDEEPYYIGE